MPESRTGRTSVYRQLGAIYHADWAFHQYVDRNASGVPLSESFQFRLSNGESYVAQIFSLETLISPHGQWDVIVPLSSLLNMPNLEPRKVERRDLLLSRQFQRVGSAYHAGWTLHQAALRLGLGAPLSDQERVEMGEQDYVAQLFARDILYSPMGDWGIVKQLDEPL